MSKATKIFLTLAIIAGLAAFALVKTGIWYVTIPPQQTKANITLVPTIAPAPLPEIEFGIPELNSICKFNPHLSRGNGGWDCRAGVYRGAPQNCVHLPPERYTIHHADGNETYKPISLCFREVNHHYYQSMVATLSGMHVVKAQAVEITTYLNGVEQFGFATGAWRKVDMLALAKPAE